MTKAGHYWSMLQLQVLLFGFGLVRWLLRVLLLATLLLALVGVVVFAVPARASADSAGTTAPVQINKLLRQLNDQQLSADAQTLKKTQNYIANMAQQHGADDYHIARAQAWLDMAQAEYHEQDPSEIAQQALRLALLDVQALHHGHAKVDAVPQLHKPVRQSLWQQLTAWKDSHAFSCASREIARLEVALVHAGHEYAELGWRHAEPQVMLAERWAEQAQARILACPPAKVESTLPQAVFFGLDSVQLTAANQQNLQNMAAWLKRHATAQLQLQGHADRLGERRYNQRLSASRALAVRDYLLEQGVAARQLSTQAYGASAPISQACEPAALARNRRVELALASTNLSAAVRRPPAAQQQTQPEALVVDPVPARLCESHKP